jgi:MFS family permease
VRAPRLETLGLAVAVGMVLADSSVVILALPEILRDYDIDIPQVTWVITTFNLVLALFAVPAALLGRRRPREVCALGLVVFAAASLGCALAPSFGWLVAFRCVQAVGGAAVVCAALELLPRTTGSEARAVAAWASAGALGAAIGPAAGGLLTEAISWQAIFIAQTPTILLAVLVMRGPAPTPAQARVSASGRPRLGPNIALGLVSAALTAALFLLVLLLIEGWRMSPIQAAATVTVMPVFAFAAAKLSRAGSLAVRAAAGAVLIGGGLAALGLLPGAGWGWTVLPQALVGLGLGLALAALTERALHGTSPQAVHGGWTMAARHAGVVIGLLLLTPVFTAALDDQRDRALQSGVAALLDAPIDPERKVALGQDIADTLQGLDAELPDLGPAFDENEPAGGQEQGAFDELRATLTDEIDRAATDAFSTSFLVASAFALVALIPIAISRRRVAL